VNDLPAYFEVSQPLGAYLLQNINAYAVMSISMIHEEGCLVVLCIWHFTGCFDIHVYVEESSAYHFAG
jgi:hypothetical protein